MKKYLFITFFAIIYCYLLSGCESNSESAPEKIIYIDEPQNESGSSPEISTSSKTTATIYTMTVPQPPESSSSTSSSSRTASVPGEEEPPGETESTSSSSQTASVPEDEEPPEETYFPQWSETPFGGELYVNTDGVYSRVEAIQGSETVSRYTLNDKVTVVAKTDTDYCKLPDGTFIHADFLSEYETVYETENPEDYVEVLASGYVLEVIDGITYVDGIMIANKTYTLPRCYDPGVRQEAAEALEEMQNAAAAEGLSLFVVSGYRSYDTQEAVYAGWVDLDGREQADTYSSRAGHSDHQTGYTFDLNSLEESFAYTPEGIWLAEHCAEFGFIIRYPKGKEAYTGYVYEPWHVRYIGREKAEMITRSGLSLEEFYGITSYYVD